MNHSELLKSYELNKLDENTVFIYNKHFNFSYTKADSVVKYEFKGQYKYFGGLQCRFEKDSQQYKILESNLCEIAESVLGENKSESLSNSTKFYCSIDLITPSARECYIKLKSNGDELFALYVDHKNCFVDFDQQHYPLDVVEYFIPINMALFNSLT